MKNVDGHRSLPSVIIGGGWPPLSIRHLFYFLLILPPWRMSNGFHSLEWVVERFFPCFISIYHPEERGAGMIERLDPSWIDWKRANGKGFRNDSSLMIDERRR